MFRGIPDLCLKLRLGLIVGLAFEDVDNIVDAWLIFKDGRAGIDVVGTGLGERHRSGSEGVGGLRRTGASPLCNIAIKSSNADPLS